MRIVIWGIGKDALEMLGLLDLERVTAIAFVDDVPEAKDATFLDREVEDPSLLPSMEFDALFIAGRHWQEPWQRAVKDLCIPAEKIFAWHGKRFELLANFGKMGVIPPGIPEKIVKELDAKEWYHQVEVFPGVTTPGPAAIQSYLLDLLEPGGFAGKKVLDIGAWTGPYTFEVERRGGQVTSFDIQDPERSGFNLLKTIKGSKAEYIQDSVYNLAAHFKEYFDIILFLGVFYHLKNPVLALENIHAALKPGAVMIYEGAVLEHAYSLDPVWADRKDRMGPYLEIPLAYYATGDCLGHFSNWYVPNVLCLREWIISSGFDPGQTFVLPQGSRAFGLARKIGAVPLEHSS